MLASLFRYIVAFILFVLAGCGGGSETKPGALSGEAMGKANILSNSNIEASTTLLLQSERRIGRTKFEYTFKVQLHNSGPAIQSALVKLVGAGDGTTIIKPTVKFGALNAGVTGLSLDELIVQHERTLPFDQAALRWLVTTIPESGTEDLPGADADRDGVRDDIGNYITNKYGTTPSLRTALMQLALGLQSSTVATTDSQRAAADTQRLEAGRCLFSAAGSAPNASRLADEIKSQHFDNESRIRAEFRFRAWMAGRAMEITTSPSGACK